MKAKEIIWKEVSVLPHSANAYPKGKPYKGQMMMGRVFPVSKAQAMAFVEMGCCIAEMNSEDVSIVEKLLVKHHPQSHTTACPEQRAGEIKQQKRRQTHAQSTRHGRRKRGQTWNEFRQHQSRRARFGKAQFALAHTGIG